MNTKNNILTDTGAKPDRGLEALRTLKCEKFDEETYALYTGQILSGARREVKVTQLELTKRINATKSYILRAENGAINPSVGAPHRIVNALGSRIEIVKPIIGI